MSGASGSVDAPVVQSSDRSIFQLLEERQPQGQAVHQEPAQGRPVKATNGR